MVLRAQIPECPVNCYIISSASSAWPPPLLISLRPPLPPPLISLRPPLISLRPPLPPPLITRNEGRGRTCDIVMLHKINGLAIIIIIIYDVTYKIVANDYLYQRYYNDYIYAYVGLSLNNQWLFMDINYTGCFFTSILGPEVCLEDDTSCLLCKSRNLFLISWQSTTKTKLTAGVRNRSIYDSSKIPWLKRFSNPLRSHGAVGSCPFCSQTK